MTNLNANFKQILEFAKSYGLPESKKRAIIREYLQAKIISLIYKQRISLKVYFVGGTALRMLYGLDRFSEDLDFDVPEVSRTEIRELLQIVSGELNRENFKHDFYGNLKENKDYFELRFPDILFASQISADEDEKLMIKLDFEAFWKKQAREVVFLNRYGFLANVVTKSLGQFLVEKLAAFLNRPKTEGRDVYDIVWLYAQGAKPDIEFARDNGLAIEKLILETRKKFIGENKALLKTSLKPFLLKEENVDRIDFWERFIS